MRVMNDLSFPLILAADGGGTKCRMVLCGEGLWHEVEVGAANVSSDFAGAVAELSRGITELAAMADGADLTDVPAYLGLAGVKDAEIATRVAAALPLQNVRVEEDRMPAVRGALGDADGVIAHCGTGSFFAARIGGELRFTGGWGWKLGDEASGFWLGHAALRQALAAEDGVQARSGFVDGLLRRFQGGAGLMAWADTASVREIAGLAQEVSAHAAEGDAVAAEVMRAGADVLAEEVRAIGWRSGLPLCLTGGLAGVYVTYLPEDLRAAVQPVQGRPIDGAVALAREFADVC